MGVNCVQCRIEMAKCNKHESWFVKDRNRREGMGVGYKWGEQIAERRRWDLLWGFKFISKTRSTGPLNHAHHISRIT